MVRRYKWFVAPLNEHTNGVIADMLPQVEESRDVKCKDGVEPCLWPCPHNKVGSLMKSRIDDKRLEFKIFEQAGNGQIRESPLYMKWYRKKQKPPAPAPATT